MKKVYVLFDASTGDIHKIFTSRQFADVYLQQIDDRLSAELSDVEEYKVEH